MSDKMDKDAAKQFYSYMRTAGYPYPYPYPSSYPISTPHYPPQDTSKEDKDKKSQSQADPYSQMYGYPPYPYPMQPMSYPQSYSNPLQEGKRDEEKGKQDGSNPYSYNPYTQYPYYNPYAYHAYYYGRDYANKTPSFHGSFNPYYSTEAMKMHLRQDKAVKQEIVISSDSEQANQIPPQTNNNQQTNSVSVAPPSAQTHAKAPLPTFSASTPPPHPPSPPIFTSIEPKKQTALSIPAPSPTLITKASSPPPPVPAPVSQPVSLPSLPPKELSPVHISAQISIPNSPPISSAPNNVELAMDEQKPLQKKEKQVASEQKQGGDAVIIEQNELDPFFIHKSRKIFKEQKHRAPKIFKTVQRVNLNTRYAGMDSEAYKEMMKKQARARLDMFYERQRQRKEQEALEKEKELKEKSEKLRIEKEKADKERAERGEEIEGKKPILQDKSEKEKKEKQLFIPRISAPVTEQKESKKDRMKDDHPLKELRHNESHGRIRLGAYFQSTIPGLLPHKQLAKRRLQLQKSMREREVSAVTF